MGTRGTLAFHYEGVTKATYNQNDSYPDWLGTKVLEWLKQIHNLAVLRERVSALKPVTDEQPPTPEQQGALRQFANMNVSTRRLDDWYVLLRETQGDPDKILTAGYFEDRFDFGYDSLFCEWGYVVDLDAGNFDVYSGFNHSAEAVGLWAEAAPGKHTDGYGVISRVASFPLSDLPDRDAFAAKFEED